jgi:hypothetical protein
MRTAKQSAASRANSRKSTGPRTAAGKAKSRFNALKHGIHAESQTIFTESAEDLAELTAELHDQYGPADSTERFLIDTLVNNEWRLRRLRVIETDLWQSAIDRFLENHTEMQAATPADAFQASGPAFERLQRVINSCERNYHRALKELKTLAAAGNTPQPEEAKTTSESPAWLRRNPEIPAAEALHAASQTPADPFQPRDPPSRPLKRLFSKLRVKMKAFDARFPTAFAQKNGFQSA